MEKFLYLTGSKGSGKNLIRGLLDGHPQLFVSAFHERIFEAFCEDDANVSNKKDIEQIAEMFSEEIILNDPNGFSAGINEVLETTQNIFNSAKNIHIDVISLYTENQTVIAELEIIIDTNDLIKIVDILKFDELGKIESIRAYKM